MRAVVAMLACGAALATAPWPAHACSPARPYIDSRSTVPEDGATDVPTNARVLVEYALSDYYFVDQGLEPGVELRAPNGELVPATCHEANDFIEDRIAEIVEKHGPDALARESSAR